MPRMMRVDCCHAARFYQFFVMFAMIQPIDVIAAVAIFDSALSHLE